MKRTTLPYCLAILILFWGSGITHAAFNHQVTWLKYSGSIALSGSSFLANPAFLPFQKHPSIGAGYARKFGLQELDHFVMSGCVPVGNYGIGIHISGFGRTLYTERECGIHAGGLITSNVASGIAVDWGQVQIKNYGSDHVWRVHAGVIYHCFPVSAGLSGKNLFSSKMDRFDGTPEKTLLLHANWQVSKSFSLTGNVVFEESFPPAWFTAISIPVWESIRLFTGYDTGARRILIGCNLAWATFSANTGYDHHPCLGWSQSYQLNWEPRHARE